MKKSIDVASFALSALSNDSRRNIAKYIQKKKTASFEELRKNFNMNNNTLMFHLGKLKDGYIVCQIKPRGCYELDLVGSIMLRLLSKLEIEISSLKGVRC